MNGCQEIYEEELMPAFGELRAPGLVRAVRSLRASGAYGAKFSGAGGDGSVIGLYPPGSADTAHGVTALDALGLDAFPMEVWCSP
jgi:mevalonate kinase